MQVTKLIHAGLDRLGLAHSAQDASAQSSIVLDCELQANAPAAHRPVGVSPTLPRDALSSRKIWREALNKFLDMHERNTCGCHRSFVRYFRRRLKRIADMVDVTWLNDDDRRLRATIARAMLDATDRDWIMAELIDELARLRRVARCAWHARVISNDERAQKLLVNVRPSGGLV